MEIALTLLLIQGALGAFDTLWYHEWRQRLPSRPTAKRELQLHASRDFAYAVVFGSLAWVEWHGSLAWAFAAVLVFEIIITLWDFIEEDISRPLPAGERVMHTIMAIIYGAFLAYLVPVLVTWSASPTEFAPANHGVVSWLMSFMAVGVFSSGIRDLVAALNIPPTPAKEACAAVNS
ncbi:MAG: hypothetical protein U0792_23325 [Gemmataceae bacterium]